MLSRALHRCIRPTAVAVLLLVLGTGCSVDSLMDTNDPDLLIPEDLEGTDGLDALFAGAVTEFAAAHDGVGGSPGIAMAGGLLTDEFFFSGTGTEILEADTRQIREESTAYFVTYRRLHEARVALLRIARALRDASTGDPRIGEAYALAAVSYVLFGEHYCSGVPYSEIEPSVSFGQPTTTEETFELALAFADSALSFANGSEDVANLATLTMGRALLNLDRADAAAGMVSVVPTSFSYANQHSNTTGLQQNAFWSSMWQGASFSISVNEGGNGLNFGTAEDPRLVTEETGRTFGGELPTYAAVKWSTPDAPVEFATGVEARLIEAEAALRSGSPGQWMQMLNDLRATVDGLDPLTDPGSASERVALHFRERAFWLFGTAHRLGDVRRLIRQYGRSAETLYPTGPYYAQGLQYGSAVTLPIPLPERNNPNFDGCLSSGA